MDVDVKGHGKEMEGPMFMENKLLNGHRLKLCHSFGIYPSPIHDAVIAHGDDAFIFCSGRHIAISDHVRHKVTFLERDTKNRIVTAMAKSPNGRLLAVATKSLEQNTNESVQISIYNLPKIEVGGINGGTMDLTASRADDKGPPKVLYPKNAKKEQADPRQEEPMELGDSDELDFAENKRSRQPDIIGLAFTGDAKSLVSLSGEPHFRIIYWNLKDLKPKSVHDIKVEVTRLQLNPNNGSMISISGPKYLRVWMYSSITHALQESPSMFPVKDEKRMNIVDHCWILSPFMCAITEDGDVHLFEDGEQGPEHRHGFSVHDWILKDEASGAKAIEKEQAKLLAKMGMGARAVKEPPPVKLQAVAPWSRGFVVGGDQGYLGVFKVDQKLQVESFGTFRIPGEQATIWQMCSGSEDTYLTIMSYTDKMMDEDMEGKKGGSRSMSKRPTRAGSMLADSSMVVEEQPKERIWNLHTFPVGQADLAAADAQRQEVFTPVYPLGTHHSEITCLSRAGHRRVFATCGNDMQLKVWAYPKMQKQHVPGGFTSQLSFPVSTYEKPRACAMHPLGFQVAIILEDVLRVYHLTTQQMTRTLFDLSLKHPGDVCYSNSGHMLAVSAGNDVILLDPWCQSLIHLFTSHLSPVQQVLFSDNDQMLFSCGEEKHGAIYGFELETEDKDKAFEHISKGTTYGRIGYDMQQHVVVALTRPEGTLRVIEHLSTTPSVELISEDKFTTYTTLHLCVPLKTLFVGTATGSIRLFRWPLRAVDSSLRKHERLRDISNQEYVSAVAANNPFAEYSMHAHSITSLALSCSLRYLFTSCSGGAAMICNIETVVNGQTIVEAEDELNAKKLTYRHKQYGTARRIPNKEEVRKIEDLKKKLGPQQVVSASSTSLDEMVMVPKVFYQERLDEIRDLEERMRNLQNENEYALEQKDQEIQEKLNTVNAERKHQTKGHEEKYDALFVQHTTSLERSEQAIKAANTMFNERNKEMQDQFDERISAEWEKQDRLLNELKDLREQHEVMIRDIEQKHEEQLNELRKKQERDMREWRSSYEQVCNLLKSDGLKFEEALQQQEAEYEQQLDEMREHKRFALQVESEKSTTALKDGVSMKQTISMLQKQRKEKDEELRKVKEECEYFKKELKESEKMFAEVNKTLAECKRGLLVKDEVLKSTREQMKHLESFRFVLFQKVKMLEEERDPLEEQVNKLKSSVGDMYNEFVREFRQKQHLNHEFSEKKTLASALQAENVKLRAYLTQLKKDGRRLLSDMEQVLHADGCAEYGKLSKLMANVCEKNRKMSQWTPPKDELPTDGHDPFVDPSKNASLIDELVTHRDLLFRKNQIAVGAASQSKRDSAIDVRRLTSDNAQLIAEMNKLRTERKEWQRSYKDLENKLMAVDAENNAKARLAGKSSPEAVNRSSSAPSLDPTKSPMPRTGGGAGETPYVRRKVIDQQEVWRRQKVKGMNQLPPMTQSMSSSSTKPSPQEKRFTQSVDEGRQQMERQGFDMGSLRTHAIATNLPLHGMGTQDVEKAETGDPVSFVGAEDIQSAG